MKDLKSFNCIEMGIDVNDIKILINAGFQYLIKTCHQWAKDHPLVSGVLLFFYLLYIFFPPLFSILFYTFPLVICTAILLGGTRIKPEKRHQSIKKEDDQSCIDDGESSYHHSRSFLTPQMSRRTIGKDKSKDGNFNRTEGISKEENREEDIDPFVHKIEKMYVKKFNDNSTSDNGVSETTQKNTRSSTATTSRSETDSDDDEEEDDDEPQEERNKVVQWTEDDQRNLMDLGSSEIERNRRLESLIAKRRARKLLSMQPRMNHIDYSFYLGDYDHPHDHHKDSVGPVMVPRTIDDRDYQPGSAPSVLLPTRNPFDLPYDPHEEKPILTGGSFEHEFFATATTTTSEQKELPSCNHESFIGEFKDPVSNTLPSFFSKPKAADKPGYSRFRRESDTEESLKEIAEEISQEGNDQTLDEQESPHEGKDMLIQSDCLDQPTTLPPAEEESNKSETEAQSQNIEPPKSDAVSSTESKKEEELVNEEQNIFQMDSELTQDQVSINKDHDDGDDREASSSSSSCEAVRKNEAFRSSVKKVLTCLVKDKAGGVHLYDSSPTAAAAIPTKMEERSYYTSRSRHKPTYSIASDMQVEVSDTGSPRSSSAALDPNSPTDRESLVYDGDEERDANSGDEDLWGASPHPIRLGDLGTKFKLPDILEESNNIKGSNLEFDHKGETIEPKLSESSDSQMQGKSEHLAEYLANLPPSETASNIIEDTGPSHVRDTRLEEITIQYESNPIFEMDDDKEDSRENRDLEESQGNSEQSSSTGQSEAPKEMSLTCNEYIVECELNKEYKDQIPFVAEQNQHSEILEVDSTPSQKAVTEADTSFREPLVDQKEVISDSISTNCQEEIADQPRSTEEPSPETEKDVKNTSKDQVVVEIEAEVGVEAEAEVKAESPNDSIFHEESTSMEKVTGEANQAVYDTNEFEVDDDTTNEGQLNLLESEERPQSATIEEANMELPSSTEVVSSMSTVDDSQGNSDNLPQEEVILSG